MYKLPLNCTEPQARLIKDLQTRFEINLNMFNQSSCEQLFENIIMYITELYVQYNDLHNPDRTKVEELYDIYAIYAEYGLCYEKVKKYKRYIEFLKYGTAHDIDKYIY